MPVFDFSGASASKAEAKCTYTTFHSSHTKPSPEQPIMVLDNKERQWKHHSCGVFTNPVNRTAFDFKEEDGNYTADVLKIDSRFTSLLKWLGDSRINVRLSGRTDMQYTAFAKLLLAAAQSFPQRMAFCSL